MYSKKIEEIKKEYDQRLATAEWGRQFGLDKIAELGQSCAIYENRISISIPPGKSFKIIRQAMGDSWKRFHQHTSSEGSLFINYHTKRDTDNRALIIIINALLTGEFCERIQIGTSLVPRYKIVCH